MTLEIHFILKSDATFGRGDGVAGLVDEEVEHDTKTGLPFLRGRTLKGLLVEECANLLFALKRQNSTAVDQLQQAALFLFGQAGGTLADEVAKMHVGAARLPQELCDAVRAEIKANCLASTDVLESLTAIRRQTAVDEQTGAPDEGSLRSMRVVLRQTPFVACLDFTENPDADSLALLAACVLSFRRAGTGRNRGRGRLSARLCDEEGNDLTGMHFTHFQQLTGGGEQ
jgi:hypothetical protein